MRSSKPAWARSTCAEPPCLPSWTAARYRTRPRPRRRGPRRAIGRRNTGSRIVLGSVPCAGRGRSTAQRSGPRPRRGGKLPGRARPHRRLARSRPRAAPHRPRGPSRRRGSGAARGSGGVARRRTSSRLPDAVLVADLIDACVGVLEADSSLETRTALERMTAVPTRRALTIRKELTCSSPRWAHASPAGTRRPRSRTVSAVRERGRRVPGGRARAHRGELHVSSFRIVRRGVSAPRSYARGAGAVLERAIGIEDPDAGIDEAGHEHCVRYVADYVRRRGRAFAAARSATATPMAWSTRPVRSGSGT